MERHRVLVAVALLGVAGCSNGGDGAVDLAEAPTVRQTVTTIQVGQPTTDTALPSEDEAPVAASVDGGGAVDVSGVTASANPDTPTTTVTDRTGSSSTAVEPQAAEAHSAADDVDRVVWMNSFLELTSDRDAVTAVLASPVESGLDEQTFAAAQTTAATAITAGLTGEGWEAWPELYPTAPEPWQQVSLVGSAGMRAIDGSVMAVVVWSGTDPDGGVVDRTWVFVAMTDDGTRPAVIG